MENKKPRNRIQLNDDLSKEKSASLDMNESSNIGKKDENIKVNSNDDSSFKGNSETINKRDKLPEVKAENSKIPQKPIKPPKIEDKPFEEFINYHLIPGLKGSIEETGTSVSDIKFIEGKRPVVGGNCWMIFCEISKKRRFWLCFSKDLITSDKTILLAESDSEPSIVESFLIDEKKTTLPLLISRVLQRLNGQKWIGAN
tara:strand:+ start:838 stop:1437 length:600 start_codon:yes stop_codon:yes gene_type:complete